MNFLMSRQFKSRSIGVGTSRKVTRKRLRCTMISIHMQSIVRFPYKRFVTSSLHILSRLPTDYKRTVSSLHEPFCGVIQVPIHQYSPSFQHISFDSVIHKRLATALMLFAMFVKSRRRLELQITARLGTFKHLFIAVQ